MFEIALCLNGRNLKGVKLLISGSRTRCLFGLGIQPKLGILTTQLKPPTISINAILGDHEYESAESNFWKNH